MHTLEFFDSTKVELAGLKQILTAEPGFVHLQDARGETALFLAIEHGANFVSALLEAGADVNSRNQTRETPLHRAAEDYDAQVAQLLIDSGADVDAPDNSGRTPLHAAAMHGAYKVADVLVRNRAKVNCRDAKGNTPLHDAVYGNIMPHEASNYLKVAEILICANADLQAETNEGKTPLDLAKLHFGYPEIAELLVRYGAK